MTVENPFLFNPPALAGGKSEPQTQQALAKFISNCKNPLTLLAKAEQYFALIGNGLKPHSYWLLSQTTKDVNAAVLSCHPEQTKGLKYYRRSFLHVPRITNDIFVNVTLRETKGLKISRDLSPPQAPVQDDGDINAAVSLISDDSQNSFF